MGGRGRRLQPGQVSTSRSHTDELVGGAGDRAGRARQGHVGSAAAAAVGPSDQRNSTAEIGTRTGAASPCGRDVRGTHRRRRSINKRFAPRFLCLGHHYHFVRHVDDIIIRDGISKSASLACSMCLVYWIFEGVLHVMALFGYMLVLVSNTKLTQN